MRISDADTLGHTDLKNEASYNAISTSVSFGGGGSSGVSGTGPTLPTSILPGVGVPTSESKDSTTKSAVAAGTITIYRIIREALLNAIKHSRAKNLLISVHAQSRERMLHISIRDDGKGIDEGATPGVGLIDMRIRALQANGTLSIRKGDHNCGTVIELRIPLPR